MSNANPYHKYQEQAVYTMTPGERIILLYDKAVQNMNLAITYIDKKDIPQAHNYIIKAEDIVLYLRKILDMKYPIAKILFDYYTFIYKQLVKANVKKDKELLEQLILTMKELKDTWLEVDSINHEKAVSKGSSI